MGEFTILATGTLVASRYRIEKVLGKGGMGAVYQAQDIETSLTVALKTLRVDLYEREDLVKRFEREARAAARIGHPSIVGVHAVGHDDALRTRFIVQEKLRGTDVAGCLNELGSLSPLSAVAIAMPVIEALVAAHGAGIVHRDIKPENVFLHETDDGTVIPKVIDFGIAKVVDELDRMERTATGMVFGTPWYMSPEQALGDSSIDARTDVWSVGAMLYEMVCGTLPFNGNSPNAVMAQIIFGVPTPLQHHWPDAPDDLHAAIHKALERDLDKRYATMAEFRDALVACSLWRDVTPELAMGFLPRPSSFEGISDILPAEFMNDPTDLRRLRRPSRSSSEAARGLVSDSFGPQPLVPTANVQVVPAPRAACSDAHIGTELRLSVPPTHVLVAPRVLPSSQVTQRRHRVEFDTMRPSTWGRRGPSRLVSAVSVVLTLFCGAVLVVGAMHWIRRPQPELLTSASASFALPAVLRSAAVPGAGMRPKVSATDRDRTSDDARR